MREIDSMEVTAMRELGNKEFAEFMHMSLDGVKHLSSPKGRATRKTPLDYRCEKRGTRVIWFVPDTEAEKEAERKIMAGETAVAEKPVEVSIKPGAMVEDRSAELLDVAELVYSGKATMEQASQLSKVVKELRASGMTAVLEGKMIPLAELKNREQAVAGAEAEYNKKLDEMVRENKLARERQKSLDADARKVALVKVWAAETVAKLTSSQTWNEACHAEGVELPEWPETVDVEEVIGWKPPEKPKSKARSKARTGKKQVQESQFDESEE